MNSTTRDPMRDQPTYRILRRLCVDGSQTLKQIVLAFEYTPIGYITEWLQALERSRLIRLVGSGLYWPTVRGQRVCREIYGSSKRRQAHA